MKSMVSDVIEKIDHMQVKLRELCKLPDLSIKELNYLYNAAATKCHIGDYYGALPLFQLLVFVARGNDLYIKGLAGANHGVGSFHLARDLYQIVFQQDQNL